MRKICIFMTLLILLSAFAGCNDIIPDVSEQSSDTQIFLPASDVSDTSNSSEHLVSSAEPSVEPSEEVSMTYEEYIGKNYVINIEPYLEYISPADAERYLLLVNYDSRLTSAYAPDDLVDTKWTRNDGRDKQRLCKTVAMALDAFLKEAAEYSVKNVTVTSAYRSYSYQKWLFNYYVEKNAHKFKTIEEAEEYVMTFSCREGCSEHQSGMACDMHNLSAADVSFAKTYEAQWLAENAHRFGFIVRFPADKVKVTGIDYEPWHFRFVGREAATYMYENNLCLEEYINLLSFEETEHK